MMLQWKAAPDLLFLFFNADFYNAVMSPPSFPMTENSFWTSEQRSLISIWMKISISTSQQLWTFCLPPEQALIPRTQKRKQRRKRGK
jgi:hypothetical protein